MPLRNLRKHNSRKRSRNPRRAEGARGFHLLAITKTSAPQSAAYAPCVISTERSERRNLWNIAARVLYSLFGNTICIQPSRGGAKTRSKACIVLPCLQGVKRARRNRRHMGACPWQLVAESASFSAADYSPPFLLGGSLKVTQKGSCPVIPSLSRDLLLKYRHYFLRDPSTARLRRSAQDDKRCCTFLYSNCAFQNRILNKRPQFAESFRLNSERVNAARLLSRAFHRAPENRSVRKQCEIFGKEAKQCRSACGLAFATRSKAGVVLPSRREKNGG